jgi:hypothetical protein
VLYGRSGWTIRHYDAERQRAERILARIDGLVRDAPAGVPVVTYNEPYRDGPFVAGAAALYVMHGGDRSGREVYFVDRGAVNLYGRFPASPLAHALLPPPLTGRECRDGVPLQSEAE